MKRIYKITLLICLFLAPALLEAQPPSFDGESPLYGVTDVPFDDGVFLLVGLAVVYGFFKVRAYKTAERNKKFLLNN